MSGRILNEEFADTDERLYAYDFDYRMHDYMLRTFRDQLPAGRALELGCYKGEFTKKLASLFDHLTVVEGASDLIEVARTVAPPGVEFVLSQFEAFTPQQKVDAVFLVHTLEHLDEPAPLLARIGTWLAPGGKLFLVVPNAHAASRQIAVEMGLISHPTAVTEGERLHGHRRTYNAESLLIDVKAAGLEPVETGGIFFKPFANFQFDKLMKTDIVGDDYMEGCFKLGRKYPDLCASIYAICETGKHGS